MAPLDVKLLRDLRRLWAQSLAIALVLAAGVAILVLAFGAQVSLFETRAAYYERNRFADVFAAATRAPLSLASRDRRDSRACRRSRPASPAMPCLTFPGSPNL